MSEQKKLLEKLLQVTNKQQVFFDRFLAAEDIQQAAAQWLQAQKFIVEAWEERSRVNDIIEKHVVIPNAKVNKPYHFLFDTAALGLQEYKWEIPAATGLTVDADNTFTGTPQEAGEFILTLLFKLKTESPFSEKKITLVINPDPKSLWKQLPSDTNAPHWQPDQDALSLPFGDRTLIIASKRGRSHAHEGSFRDDSFGAAFDSTSGWGVIAVADGAGSARYSRRGASLACQTVVEQFQTLLKSEKIKTLETAIEAYLKDAVKENEVKLSAQFIEQLGKIAFAAQQRIKQEPGELRDYSTTLLFTIIKKYAAGYVIGSFWVGDGGIGIYDDNTVNAIVLGTPDSGEFAGQTRFLTMSEIFADNAYVNRIRFKVVPDFTTLILMTDGITDPKFQTDANLRNGTFWQQLWKDLNGDNEDNCKVESEKDLLNWLDFWSPGNHDDRTIAILR